MKKLLISAALLFLCFTSYAQTEEGTIMIEANTSFASIGGLLGSSGTGFNLSVVDGTTIWNIGGEAGYFVSDQFAIKLGLGFGDFDGASLFSFRVGGKYYAANKVPLQVDITNQSGEDIFGSENPTYLGLQAGYAIFIGESKRVSIEPSLRYNISINEVFEDILQLQAGFSIFL